VIGIANKDDISLVHLLIQWASCQLCFNKKRKG